MAYTKTNWVNDSSPAINASNLNKIEQGIYDNADMLDTMFFQPNDTYSVTYAGVMPCPGFVTTSTTTVYFTLNVPKSLDLISSVAVTSMTGGMRGISGYVNGTTDSSDLKTGYTVNALIMDEFNIRIQITKSSAMTNTTNNTPVQVSLKSISLTLS